MRPNKKLGTNKRRSKSAKSPTLLVQPLEKVSQDLGALLEVPPEATEAVQGLTVEKAHSGMRILVRNKFLKVSNPLSSLMWTKTETKMKN